MSANFVGRKYGRWTVISEGPRYIRPNGTPGNKRLLCKCDCGNEGLVGTSDLKWGRSSSCGCYGREAFKRRTHNEKFREQTKDHYFQKEKWAVNNVRDDRRK